MKKKKQLPRLIDAPVYGYWRALYMAFYSKQLYVDVAKRWKGVCFLYLWLVIAVMSLPLTARLMYDYNLFIKEQIIEPLVNIPPLELRDGVVSFNEPMPYFVKSKTGAVVAMIDTRTDGRGMEGTNPELMLLITRDKFYFRSPTINLFPKISTTPTPHKPIIKEPEKGQYSILVLSEWLESSGILNTKWLVAGLIYPFIVSFIFGVFFIIFLVVTMLAQVFSWTIFRYHLKFTDAMRILIVSSTAQLSVLLILLGVNVWFSGMSFVCLALSLIYFSYAVLSVKRDSQKLVHS